MNCRNERRTFFKHLFSLTAFSAASILSFNRNTLDKIDKLGLIKKAHAVGNSDYMMINSKNMLRIEYVGLSCFVITSSNGTKIITDPFLADKNIFHAELQRETADVVTISCGHYAHCNVCTVGGSPYLYQITEPTEIKGIKFKGVTTRHPTISDVMSTIEPGINVVICFEVDGIKICHLGALGHKLSDDQIEQIGKVDILMVPVGGVSSMPVDVATEVCNQLNPRVILPMHYKSERCPIPGWATVDEFLKDKKNIARCDSNVGSSQLVFSLNMLPTETMIVVPRFVY